QPREDVLLDFLCARGGRVTNAELLARFKGFLRGDVDVQVRERHRQLFKRFVNSVAFVERDAAGVASVVLKRRYRELVGEESDFQSEPQDECNSDWECPTVSVNARPLWDYKEEGCGTARLEPLTDCQNDMNLMNLQRPLGRLNRAECSDIGSNRTAQQPTTVLLQHNIMDANEQNFSVDQWMSHEPDHQLENSAMHLSNQQPLKVLHDESENICPRLAPHLIVEQALNWKKNSLTASDPPITDTSKERQLDISKSKDERHKSKTSEIARHLMSQSCSPLESPLQVQNARLGNKAEHLGKNKHQLRTDFTSQVMKTENMALAQSARCFSVTDIHKLNTKPHAQSVDKLILAFNENESFTFGQNARKYYKHEWLVKAAVGNWNEIYGLFKEEPSLILKKDFISGYTVLHWLATHGDHRVLNTLCYGASKAKLPIDVNVRSTGGYTPLHLAVMYKRKKTIKMLVQSYKANVNLRDNSGRKPWQYLEKTGSLDLRYLLGAPLGKLKNDTVSRQSSTERKKNISTTKFSGIGLREASAISYSNFHLAGINTDSNAIPSQSIKHPHSFKTCQFRDNS
uniref:SOWAHA-C winged helix-turn-helix domain-containing protein n=1 Tax=Erpetoichthys calabaricus TaxID=27687 RepID=A0A8C4RZK8_ERPCA